MRPKKKRRSGISPALAGGLLIVVALMAVYFGFTKSIPFRHHFTIKAAFASADNIAANSPVRIAGVNVGKVTGIAHLGSQSAAVVTMTVDDQGLPIHRDATVEIRPRIFLEGNFFVDVHPGSPSAPALRDGGMIPIGQTADPVQLDQVLSTLKTATRTQLQQLLAQLSTGFSGRGAASFNLSIPAMTPAFRYNSVVNQALLGQNQHDLSNYIKSAGAVAAATNADPAALRNLISDFDTTAGALAARDRQLAAAIQELPNTLGVGVPSLRAVNRALPSVNALATALDPGVRSSLPAIKASIPLVTQLRYLVSPPELEGLVADLRPTVPALVRLNQTTVPLLDQVRAASSCQNNVILPWSHLTLKDAQFPATGQVYQESVKFLPGIAGESRSGDSNGQWFRVLLVAPNFAIPAGNGQNLLSSAEIMGTNPPHPTGRPNLRPDIACETQPVPNLDNIASGKPAGEVPITVPNTPLNTSLEAKATRNMVLIARRMMKTSGMNNLERVSSTPITANEIPRLKSTNTFLGK